MRSPHEDSGSLDRLAYELSLGALERQERTLDELRARTGILLAASSLAASFLGARAADAGSGWLTFAALGAFVASIVLMALILMPTKAFIFSLRGTALLEAEREDPGGLTETYRRLAYWIEGYLDANQPRLGLGGTLGGGDCVLMAEKPVPPPPPNLGIPETRGGGSGGEKRQF